MAFTKNPTHPHERFDQKVLIVQSGCWLWTGHIDQKGYGIFGVTSKELWRAHRYSYTRYIGPIPEGMQLDHLCRVRHCVNPQHLEPVTNQENVIRGNSARPPTAHCRHGHPYEGNTYINPRGHRECVVCRKAASKRYFERKKKLALVE